MLSVCFFIKAQPISKDSLVIHLSFDGHSIDSSGNGYNGLANKIIYTADRNNKPNSAAYFNGDDSYITIPNITKLDKKLSQFTLLVTLKPENLDSVTGNLPGFGNRAAYEFLTLHRLGINALNDFFFSQIRASIGSPFIWGSWQNFVSYIMTWCTGNVHTGSGYGKDTSLISNKWFTFSLVYSGGSMKIYHNCELVKDLKPGFYPSVMDLCGLDPLQISLAKIPDSARVYGYRPFKGIMDDLRIYTRALSEYEIKIYAGDSCKPPPIKIIPKINIVYDSCFPNKVTFLDATDLKGLNIKSRIWHFSNGDTSNAISFTKTFTQLGLYKVELEIIIDTNTIEKVIDSFVIKSTTFKKFLLLKDYEVNICTKSTAMFNAFGGKFYEWKPCINLTDCSIPNPTVVALNNETYTVVSTDDNNCKDTAQVKLIVIKDDVKVFVPSAFSPNNDGLNDDFGVLSKNSLLECDFSIYNIWGQIVFKTSNQFVKWNGNNTNNGNSFVWVLNYKSFAGCNTNSLKGTVTIIK